MNQWQQWTDGNHLYLIGNVGNQTVGAVEENGEWRDITDAALPPADRASPLFRIMLFAEAPEPDEALRTDG